MAKSCSPHAKLGGQGNKNSSLGIAWSVSFQLRITNQTDYQVTNTSYRAKQRQICLCTESHYRALSPKIATTIWGGHFCAFLLAADLDCPERGTWLKYCWRQITSHFKPYELKHCETGVFNYETAGKLTACGLGHKYDVSRKATSHKWFELTLSVSRGEKKKKPYKKSLGNKPLPCLSVPHSEY